MAEGWFIPKAPQERTALHQAEAVLWDQAPGLERRNAAWVFYLPFLEIVVRGARAQLPKRTDPQDLRDNGQDGLVHAIELYEPHRQVRFTTFAYLRVRGAMLSGLRARPSLPLGIFQDALESTPQENAKEPLEQLVQGEAWALLPTHRRSMAILYFRGWSLERVGRVFGVSEAWAGRVINRMLDYRRPQNAAAEWKQAHGGCSPCLMDRRSHSP